MITEAIQPSLVTVTRWT